MNFMALNPPSGPVRWTPALGSVTCEIQSNIVATRLKEATVEGPPLLDLLRTGHKVCLRISDHEAREHWLISVEAGETHLCHPIRHAGKV